MKIISLIGIFLFIYKSNVNGRFTDDTVNLEKGWAFLQKFVFLSNNSQFSHNITFNNSYESNFIVVVYVYNEKEWNTFYYSNPTCQDLLSTSKLFHQTLHLKNYNRILLNNNLTSYDVNIGLSPKGQSAYTFSLILACDRINEEFPVRVKSVLTNGNLREFFRYHFSADEFYILESSLTFLICYVLIIVVFAFYRAALIRENRASILTILFGIVICIKLIVFFCQFFIFLNYAINGLFSYTAFIIFELFNQYSVIIFMELLILLGFGLTIIFGKMTFKISITVIITGLIYFVLITVVFISYLSTYNSANASGIYDQYCGYFLVAIQFVMVILFVIGCSIIIAKKNNRRNFYSIFMVVIFLWFISVPVLILVSLNYIAAYLRFATVIIVRNTLDSLVHMAYIFMTFPKLFPSLVMYTTPATKIVDISYGEALENADKDVNDIEVNNNQFFDLSLFQVS